MVYGNQVGPYLAPRTGAMAVNYPSTSGPITPQRFNLSDVKQVTAPSGQVSPAPLRVGGPAQAPVTIPLTPASTTPVHQTTVRPDTTNLIAFPGLDNSVFGGGPADPSVAPGPNNLVEAVNESWGIFAKTFGQQYVTTLQSFFGTSATESVFDPHTLYDPISGHFVVIADDNGVKLDIAVSTTSDPSGSWCKYTSFGAQNTSGQFADFPMIGMDTRNFYISFNEFSSDNEGSFQGNKLIAIPRTVVESCGSPNVVWWSNLNDPGGPALASSIAPATSETGVFPQAFFVNNYPGGGSYVTSRYLATNGALYSYQLAVPAYSSPVPAKQESTSALLDPGDGRIFQAIEFNFGLYAAFTTKCTLSGKTGDCVEWLKIDDGPNPPSLTSSGVFGAAGGYYIYPAMGQAADGTALITATYTSPSVHPQATDLTISLTGTLGPNVYLLGGPGAVYDGTPSPECGANCFRWGDFASAYNDPTNMNQWWVDDQISGSSATQWATVLGNVGE